MTEGIRKLRLYAYCLRKILLDVLLVLLIIFGINAVCSFNQGQALNSLDEWVMDFEHTDHNRLANTLNYISASMHSPRAQLRQAKHELASGNTKSGHQLLFDVTQQIHGLGLPAGKLALQYAQSEMDMGYAASYLMWAAVMPVNGGGGEAARLLGFINLADKEQISCDDWQAALRWFKQAANHGDGAGLLITALSAGAELGTDRNNKTLLGNLMVTERGEDRSVAALARKVLATMPSFLPVDPNQTKQERYSYPSTQRFRQYLAETLVKLRPDIAVFHLTRQALPMVCRKSDSGTDQPGMLTTPPQKKANNTLAFVTTQYPSKKWL